MQLTHAYFSLERRLLLVINNSINVTKMIRAPATPPIPPSILLSPKKDGFSSEKTSSGRTISTGGLPLDVAVDEGDTIDDDDDSGESISTGYVGVVVLESRVLSMVKAGSVLALSVRDIMRYYFGVQG